MTENPKTAKTLAFIPVKYLYAHTCVYILTVITYRKIDNPPPPPPKKKQKKNKELIKEICRLNQIKKKSYGLEANV